MKLKPNTDHEVWHGITTPYEGTDAQLPSEVHNIRMNYPFPVVRGSYNVYPMHHTEEPDIRNTACLPLSLGCRTERCSTQPR